MTYLKHNKVDIACIQESNFKSEEAMKIKFGRLEKVFHSLFSSKQNAVVILTE